jgi:hypothetical protein
MAWARAASRPSRSRPRPLVCAYPALGYEHASLVWNGIASEADAQQVLHDERAHYLCQGVAEGYAAIQRGARIPPAKVSQSLAAADRTPAKAS